MAASHQAPPGTRLHKIAKEKRCRSREGPVPMSKQERRDDGPVTVFQRVGVEATVTIVPQVSCGPLTITYMTGRVTPCPDGSSRPEMQQSYQPFRVTVYQELCVAVPVTFGAEAACTVDKVLSGDAVVEPSGGLPYLPDSAAGSGQSSDSSSGSSSDGSSDSSSDSIPAASDSDTPTAADQVQRAAL